MTPRETDEWKVEKPGWLIGGVAIAALVGHLALVVAAIIHML